MENKNLSQMSNEEILRQQLQLLAECSQITSHDELPALTHAMVEIYKALITEDGSII
jgi:hypothetical protein